MILSTRFCDLQKKQGHVATFDFPRTRCDNPTDYLAELPCASRNFHNDFLPGTTALTKTVFSPQTNAQKTQCNTTIKSTPMNNHILSPKRHRILLRFMNCFCARLDHKNPKYSHRRTKPKAIVCPQTQTYNARAK